MTLIIFYSIFLVYQTIYCFVNHEMYVISYRTIRNFFQTLQEFSNPMTNLTQCYLQKYLTISVSLFMYWVILQKSRKHIFTMLKKSVILLKDFMFIVVFKKNNYH